jgi:hypothetical protein
MLVGGTYFPLISTNTSPLALIEVSSSLQLATVLDLQTRPENCGCTVVRRISKKNFFLACTSEALYMISVEGTESNPELVINLKVPHVHSGTSHFTKGMKIIDVIVEYPIVLTLAEGDNKVGEITFQ